MSVSEFKSIPNSPCKKCGSMERYKNRNCKACANLVNAAYRAADPERTKARSAAYYIANADKVNASSAAWKKANPDQKKATRAAWHAINKERVNALSAEWNAANSDRKKANDVAWTAANRDKKNASYSLWAKKNPELIKINNQNRQAKKRLNGGSLSRGLVAKLFDLQKGMCPCCRKPLGDDYHLDHKMPIALGGTNTDDNIQLLRKLCNLNKSAKHPVDFMQSRGFLL